MVAQCLQRMTSSIISDFDVEADIIMLLLLSKIYIKLQSKVFEINIRKKIFKIKLIISFRNQQYWNQEEHE